MRPRRCATSKTTAGRRVTPPCVQERTICVLRRVSSIAFGDSRCRVIHGQSALRRPTMQRFGLRDDQWERIKDLLPGREGHVGGDAADNRLFVDAVLYRYRTGVPWRDLPARFGDWNIVHQRFNRWAGAAFSIAFSSSGERRRQRIHDDRRLYRARSPAQCRRSKKTARKRSPDRAASGYCLHDGAKYKSPTRARLFSGLDGLLGRAIARRHRCGRSSSLGLSRCQARWRCAGRFPRSVLSLVVAGARMSAFRVRGPNTSSASPASDPCSLRTICACRTWS